MQNSQINVMAALAFFGAVLTIIVIVMSLAGCRPETRSDIYALATNTYEQPDPPPLCFTQDQIDWRAEQHCPHPEQAHEVALHIYNLATMPIDWTVIFQADIDSAGLTEPHSRTIGVADVVDPMSVAAHELLHAALFELTGDLDAAHTDWRWGKL